MIDLTGTSAAVSQPSLSRQGKLETAIIEVLAKGGTRSELRELVVTLAEFFRVRGVSAEGAVQAVRTVGMRAAPHMPRREGLAVGDAPEDRINMMAHWCAASYRRAD